MNLAKLAVTARKIHRFLVVIILALGLIMTATGLTLRYPALSPLDIGIAVEIHRFTSTYFAVIFLGMMLTGGYLYFYPLLRRRTPPPGNT